MHNYAFFGRILKNLFWAYSLQNNFESNFINKLKINLHLFWWWTQDKYVLSKNH